jgi:hypothetical protein
MGKNERGTDHYPNLLLNKKFSPYYTMQPELLTKEEGLLDKREGRAKG